MPRRILRSRVFEESSRPLHASDYLLRREPAGDLEHRSNATVCRGTGWVGRGSELSSESEERSKFETFPRVRGEVADEVEGEDEGGIEG